MVLLREYNKYNDISKFKKGDNVIITIPGESFWTIIKTISNTTGFITATIDYKLIKHLPHKTIKFKVTNILDIYNKKMCE